MASLRAGDEAKMRAELSVISRLPLPALLKTTPARPYTIHPQPHTLHPKPHSLHPQPLTLHPTPYTLHPTPYTLHPLRAGDEAKMRTELSAICLLPVVDFRSRYLTLGSDRLLATCLNLTLGILAFFDLWHIVLVIDF